jgi:hypothetical protein
LFYFSTGFVTVTTTKPVIIMHIGKRNIPKNVDGGCALSTGKMNQLVGGGGCISILTNFQKI